jgi:hypothetical protein
MEHCTVGSDCVGCGGEGGGGDSIRVSLGVARHGEARPLQHIAVARVASLQLPGISIARRAPTTFSGVLASRRGESIVV